MSDPILEAQSDARFWHGRAKHWQREHGEVERQLAEAKRLLLDARERLEFWTPDECVVGEASREMDSLNNYYAFRDQIDEFLGKP